MYSEKELNGIKAQIARRWAALAMPLLLCFGVIVCGFMRRGALFAQSYDADTSAPEMMITVAAAVFGAVLIFGWDFLIKPLNRYAGHIDAMMNGITHQVDCAYKSFDPDLSTVEGVVFRTMNVVCLDDAGDPYDRIFYYDAEKPLPDWREGQRLRVTFHDRQVAEVEALN